MHAIRPTLLAAAVTLLAAAAQAAPPAAPVRPVTDTYWGTQVTDNYRYLENLKDPEVEAWMHAQADYARSQIDKLPGRKALLERIHALANTDARRNGFVQRGQRYFYQLLEPGAQQPKLCYRDGLTGVEHVLVDPGTMGANSGTHYALDYYVPSWDGKRLAYGLSAGGSEASTLHVLEVDSGKVAEEAITRTDSDVVGWQKDNASFFYFRYNAPTPSTPPAELLYNARTYLHRIGTNPTGDGDTLVFGRGVSKAVDVPEGQAAFVLTSADSAYAVAAANHNLDDNPSTFYAAPLAAVKGEGTKWQRFATVADGITQVALHGNTLYFLTLGGAPRFRILATPLARPDIAHARVIVPEDKGTGVITDFGIASDGLYYRVREGMGSRLYRVDLDGKNAVTLPLPFAGNLFGPVVDATQPGALFNLQGWTQPAQLYAFDPAKKETRNTGMLPPSKVDVSQLESEEVLVTSWDGTRVPLSILHRKGLKLDGKNPTIIDAYGAYGVVIEAGFSANLVAWIERGGIYAYAHVRGGGELGEAWHLAGFKRTKHNTWLDFIACSQHLIDKGYTSTPKLAGTGTSAGGILIGNAMAWRPDLYRVILDRVGMSDLMRYETEPNGPPNVSEMGSIADEEGFHGLYAMSAYQHIQGGVPYPAVMFTTGANDPRVAPWHMMKMAARTQVATSSGLPVLLRIDYDAGHGIGSNRSQREQQQADEWSFTLWQMGDAAFQPMH